MNEKINAGPGAKLLDYLFSYLSSSFFKCIKGNIGEVILFKTFLLKFKFKTKKVPIREHIGKLQGTYREVIRNISRSNAISVPNLHRIVVLQNSVWV